MTSISKGPLEGRLLGRVLDETYRLERRIGQGGMSEVYEAVHLGLAGKHVAIKVLHPAATDDEEMYARFRREAKIANSLKSRHIVEVLHFNVTADGQPYLVMELLEGEDLRSRLAREGLLAPAVVRELVAQVGNALGAAHAQGIVHRDLKPENIFLQQTPGQQFNAKLLDFGLSKIKHSRSALTKNYAILGTPNYMSPEQAEGLTDAIDHTTDIFALGVIAYHCLTGVQPFDAPTLPGILYRVCHVDPKPATMLAGHLPPRTDVVLARAMAKPQQERYQEVGEFVRELVQVLRDTSSSRPISGVELKTQVSLARAPGQRPGLQPRALDPTLPVDLAALGGAAVERQDQQRAADPTLPQRVLDPTQPVDISGLPGLDSGLELLGGEPEAVTPLVEPDDDRRAEATTCPIIVSKLQNALALAGTPLDSSITTVEPALRWTERPWFMFTAFGAALLLVGLGIALLVAEWGSNEDLPQHSVVSVLPVPLPRRERASAAAVDLRPASSARDAGSQTVLRARAPLPAKARRSRQRPLVPLREVPLVPAGKKPRDHEQRYDSL